MTTQKVTMAPRSRAAQLGCGVIAAAGLIVDAYVHFDLAGDYSPIHTSVLSQADLFRAEAVLAIITAAAMLLRPRRYTALLGVLVAGSALAALLAYRYYDIGQLGPIPSMYEPVWFAKKTAAAIAEGAALVASALAVVISWPKSTHPNGADTD